MEPYASFANLVYYPSKKPKVVKGWTFVKSAGTTVDVWQKGDEYIVACRGTDLSGKEAVQDILDDLALANIQKTQRYKKTKEITMQYLPNVTLTGHSLGGAVAYILGIDLDIRSVTFSKPSMKASTLKMWLNKNKVTVAKNRNFRASGDLIGLSGHDKDTKVTKKKQKDPHSILNFVEAKPNEKVKKYSAAAKTSVSSLMKTFSKKNKKSLL
jgi:hypothetical protein